MGRIRNDRISIGTSRKYRGHGTPDGANSLKNLMPFLAKPTATTVRMTIRPSVRVTASCEVAVNTRNMPWMFMNSTKANSVKMNGRNFLPSWPMIDSASPSTSP